MGATTDIAAISNGGANPASEVRTALTSVMGHCASMSRSSSQNLDNALDQVEWTTEDFDTHGDLVDLANNRFVIPTGFAGKWEFYLIWQWEDTAPGGAAWLECQVNGTEKGSLHRGSLGSTYRSREALWLLDLAAGDLVTFWVDPDAASVTARGNALDHLRTRVQAKLIHS